MLPTRHHLKSSVVIAVVRRLGDIDVIITDSTGDHASFDKCLDKMIEDGLITEVLSRGKVKSCDWDITWKNTRRIDFLFSPPEEYAYATLYFTGSATFNIVMRNHALSKGYTMNEHGMYKMVGKRRVLA